MVEAGAVALVALADGAVAFSAGVEAAVSPVPDALVSFFTYAKVALEEALDDALDEELEAFTLASVAVALTL